MPYDITLLDAAPIAPEELIFNATAAILRSDPGIVAAQLTVWDWTDPIISDPNREPADDEIPLYRMLESGAVMSRESTRRHAERYEISIDIYSPGTLRKYMQRMWNLLRSAIWPQDPTRRDYVNNSYTAIPTYVSKDIAYGSSGPVAVGPDRFALKATARLGFNLSVAT